MTNPTNDLINFLQARRHITDVTVNTHNAFGGLLRYGSFAVPLEDTTEFMRLYKNWAKFFLQDPTQKLCIVETHPETNILVIDLDIRVSTARATLISQEVRHKFAQFHANIIREYVQNKDSPIDCYFAFKNPRPNIKKGGVQAGYKDGLHVMFPEFNVPHELAAIIRRRFIECHPQFFSENIPELEDNNPDNSTEKIYDEAVVFRNGWLMYLSMKDTDVEPWEVDQIIRFHKSGECETIAEKPDPIDLIDIMSLRMPKAPPTKLTEDAIMLIETERQKAALKETKKQRNHAKVVVDPKLVEPASDEDINDAEKLIGLLSKERADNYEKWINVLLCARSICRCKRLMDACIKFSSLSQKFVPGEIQQFFTKDSPGSLGIGSVHLWARQPCGIQ